MSSPLVRELAADGIPTAVTCRVLELLRAPYYWWLAGSVTALDLRKAYLANALFDAHIGDPSSDTVSWPTKPARPGSRPATGGRERSARPTAGGARSGRSEARTARNQGPPAHDDLVERDFTASTPNQLWLTDMTECATSESKVCLCAIEGVYSGRIVGGSISDRMEASLVVDALGSSRPASRC